ncbi:hypothetical protein [Herbaspirillum seropedicae]|uniref:hypothetical protein n=1 Tax=Herbaspirillum seropedicae TaxID=964 RepID=UPI001E5CA391|nr:hypothetical protein [Herbaspirillum seropedicae]
MTMRNAPLLEHARTATAALAAAGAVVTMMRARTALLIVVEHAAAMVRAVITLVLGPVAGLALMAKQMLEHGVFPSCRVVGAATDARCVSIDIAKIYLNQQHFKIYLNNIFIASGQCGEAKSFTVSPVTLPGAQKCYLLHAASTTNATRRPA